MVKYPYLLFDLDGTLTDSGEGIMRSVQYALQKFGIEVGDYHELHAFVGPPLTDTFQSLYGLSADEAGQALAFYRERYSTIGIFENSVYEGIPEILREMDAEGRILAVASSKPEVYVKKVLDHFGIGGYFRETVGSGLDLKGAQKPEIIEEVMRRFSLREEDKKKMLMIGDRRYDILGAKATGIDSMGVYYGYADPGELEEAGATYIADSVEDLGRLLRTL